MDKLDSIAVSPFVLILANTLENTENLRGAGLSKTNRQQRVVVRSTCEPKQSESKVHSVSRTQEKLVQLWWYHHLGTSPSSSPPSLPWSLEPLVIIVISIYGSPYLQHNWQYRDLISLSLHDCHHHPPPHHPDHHKGHLPWRTILVVETFSTPGSIVASVSFSKHIWVFFNDEKV